MIGTTQIATKKKTQVEMITDEHTKIIGFSINSLQIASDNSKRILMKISIITDIITDFTEKHGKSG